MIDLSTNPARAFAELAEEMGWELDPHLVEWMVEYCDELVDETEWLVS